MGWGTWGGKREEKVIPLSKPLFSFHFLKYINIQHIKLKLINKDGGEQNLKIESIPKQINPTVFQMNKTTTLRGRIKKLIQGTAEHNITLMMGGGEQVDSGNKSLTFLSRLVFSKDQSISKIILNVLQDYANEEVFHVMSQDSNYGRR